jgi:hypothetical protein
MVQQKTSGIIRLLYKAHEKQFLDVNALKHMVEMGIRWNFFVNTPDAKLRPQNIPISYVPYIEYSVGDEIIKLEHPVFKALRKIVIIPRIYGAILSSFGSWRQRQRSLDALNIIISTITKSIEMLPTITVPNTSRGKKFNYYIKRKVFHFICLLSNFVSSFNAKLEDLIIRDEKNAHARKWKKTIIPRLRIAYRNMQRKIKHSTIRIAQQAKIAAKEAQKQAKIAAKEAQKQAKIAAKEAQTQAKIAAKEAQKQAKIAAKEAQKQAKIAAKEAQKQAKIKKVIIIRKKAS